MYKINKIFEFYWFRFDNIAGIRIKEYLSGKYVHNIKEVSDDEIIICRCERIKKKDIIDYIKKTGTRDVNAIKAALRVGMGPCGGKTCTEHINRIFRELGIKIDDIEIVFFNISSISVNLLLLKKYVKLKGKKTIRNKLKFE